MTRAPVVSGGDPAARPIGAAQIAVGQRLPHDHAQVLLQTGRQDPLLGTAVQAVEANLDHVGADLVDAPGLVGIVAAQRHAELADLALGDLLVQRRPQVVTVKDLVGAGVHLVQVHVVGPQGPQRRLQLGNHLGRAPVLAAQLGR